MKRILAASLIAIASRAAGQDFYADRLRVGESELAAGRAAEAVEDLRLAAFGLMNQPPLLCQTLVSLAVAQNAAGRAADVSATLARYVEVSRGFPSCREAAIEPGRRKEFEALARRLLPSDLATEVLAAPARPAAASPTPIAVVREAPAPAPTVAAPEPTRAPTREATPAPSPPPKPAVEEPSTDLDRQPQLKTTTRPVYPEAARRAGIGGIVLLRVLVSADGRSERVEVTRGVQSDLDQAAMTAVQSWRFEPGIKAGQPTAAWMTVAVPFEAARH